MENDVNHHLKAKIQFKNILKQIKIYKNEISN